MMEALLSNAAWFFFTAWTVLVALVSVAAFGEELLASHVRVSSGSDMPRTEYSESPKLG